MCDPVVVRMSVSDKQQENPNGFKSKGGGGGSRPRSLLPVPPLLLPGVRYPIGNIDFFSLYLTLVTIRITPLFKYKLLAISKYDWTTLYFILASCRAWPVVRCRGHLALPYAGHRWWWRLRWFWGGLVNCVQTFLKTAFRGLLDWVL